MFGREKHKKTMPYAKAEKIPEIRASICTGEKIAGFKDIRTGKFEEMMLICGEEDLREFMRLYVVGEGEIRKEW